MIRPNIQTLRIGNGFRQIVRLVWASLLAASTLYGQFYFGRNKIQYEQFNWQVLTTPHFQIYYYSAEEELARASAYWAEDAYTEFEQKFNHTLGRKVPLVIYSNHLHFQQTNITPYLLPEGVGGFFEYVKGRVVLPNNGSLYNFRRVIRHELIHVFTHAKINAGARETGAWEQRNPPLWFTEGLADWWAGGWDTEAEMVIRDAILNDHLVPLEKLTLAGSGFLLYKEGQSFLRFLEQNYGADRIRRVMEEFYHYETFDDALSAVTGIPFRRLARDWRLGLKQSTAEALTEQSLPGHKSRPLTRLGVNVAPAVYRDSNGEDHLVYLSSRDGYISVYSQELGHSKVRRILRGERTPDLESMHFLQSGLGISSNGILAFSAKAFDRDVLRLVNLESLEPVGEFSHPKLATIRSPEWSPDGNQIVFTGQDHSGRTDLYLWKITEDGAVRLTNDPYLDQHPHFSPDGQAIVFSSDRGRPDLDGGINLFLIHPVDLHIQQVTFGLHRDYRPRWSQDNPQFIHFISDRGGTSNVWRLKLPSGAPEEDALVTWAAATNVYTGIVDMLPLTRDSLLVNTFDGYSYQLHLVPTADLNRPTKPDTVSLTNQNGFWTQPQYEGETTTDSRPYKLRYSLDIAQTAVAYDPIFGFLGGAQLGISDILGNRYYHFLVANTAQTSSEMLDRFNFAVTGVNLTHRVNIAYGFFRFANEYYDPYDQGFYFEKSMGIRTAMNYPFNVFQRVELSGSLWQSSRIFPSYGEIYQEETVDALLLSNYLSFVQDNTLWHPVGPIDGWRLRITGGFAYNLRKSGIHNYSALLDNRVYWRLHPKLIFAQRSMLWYNTGTDSRRFYIGGSWGMRGYRITEVYGRKLIMLNQELRFPFARSLMLNTRTFALGVAPIRGALFLDIGQAWEDTWENDQRGIIGSYGVGLRGLFMGGLVLRLDFGRRTDFHSQDSKIFTQFFFGWDF
ncbi:BamA/TamA family outer membrane protein [Candidatus Neomarinimicrobiota bacterium]